MRNFRFNVYRQGQLVFYDESYLTRQEAHANARRIIHEYNDTVSVEIVDAVTKELIEHVIP